MKRLYKTDDYDYLDDLDPRITKEATIAAIIIVIVAIIVLVAVGSYFWFRTVEPKVDYFPLHSKLEKTWKN